MMNILRIPFMMLALLLAFAVPLYAQDTVPVLVPEVIATYPHDPAAYTQGLLFHDGLLYESTGLYGFSTLRQVNLQTGEVLNHITLPDYLFAEGLALVDDRLVQITWREGVALTYDFAAFANDTISTVGLTLYETEGWGLCYDGEAIYMTDGSDTLYRRDPNTFEITGEVQVTMDGQPLANLNELECVGDTVYANVWQTDTIVLIDKATGVVSARVEAAGLLTPEDMETLGQPTEVKRSLIYDSQSQTFVVRREMRGGGAVLNGIAYNPDTDTFYMTGKLWPKLFEVRFVPQP